MDYLGQDYSGLTALSLESRPGASSCRIELVRTPSRYQNSGTDTDVMIHELIHVLHYASEFIWGSSLLCDEFEAINGGISYYEDAAARGMSWTSYRTSLNAIFSNYFVNDYASHNCYEDAASLFQAISTDPDYWKSVLLDEAHAPLLKKYRAFSQLLASHLSTAPQAPMLRLLPDDWAIPGYREAAALNLIPGGLDGDYTDDITRGDFCVLVNALLQALWGQNPADYLTAQGLSLSAPFTDTQSPDVAVLYALGIVDGKSPTLFVPDAPITRQEAAKMLALTATATGGMARSAGTAAVFKDQADFADWARPFIQQAYAAGIMYGTGEGVFSPQRNYTRQQSFLTMVRLYHYTAASMAQSNAA